MKKILVTTDFSAPSKAGLRFAIQLATQMDCKLVFFHCFQALVPTTIHREQIERAVREQTQKHLAELEAFVQKVHKDIQITPGTHQCVVAEDMDTEYAILNYAQNNAIDYICMSTRGAGGLKKLIGTNTGNIIRKSNIPVLAVPHDYRKKPLKSVLYATDMEHIDKEMPLANDFATSIEGSLNVAHILRMSKANVDWASLSEDWRTKYKQFEKAYWEDQNLETSITGQLNEFINKRKPSVVLLFTHKSTSWFDKLFGSSHSEDLSFVSKVPLLIIKKGEG